MMPAHARLHPALISCLLSLLTLSACAPMTIFQEAQLVRKGADKVGFGGTAAAPLEPDTRFDPDGGLTSTARKKQPDLQFIPLPALTGWIRRGTGWGEHQASVSLPSFIITLATKVGLFGRKQGSALAMSISGEINFSPVTGTMTAGATLLFSASVGEGVSLDLSSRVGNFAGLWLGLGVAPTVGLSLDLANGARLHLGVGGNLPTGVGPSPATAWIYAGATLK